jgi:hypothetical protein
MFDGNDFLGSVNALVGVGLFTRAESTDWMCTLDDVDRLKFTRAGGPTPEGAFKAAKEDLERTWAGM